MSGVERHRHNIKGWRDRVGAVKINSAVQAVVKRGAASECRECRVVSNRRRPGFCVVDAMVVEGDRGLKNET